MKSIFSILAVFFVLLFAPLALDQHFNETLTGRGIGGSLALISAFTAWRWIQARRAMRAADNDARLRRRALMHLNGERGELAGPAVLVCLVVMAMAAPLCMAADPTQIDKILAEASGQLFPAVPLSGQELEDLQAMALSLGVISKELQNIPGDMPAATRERRFAMRRGLDRLHSGLVDLMVQHAGAVIQASRKGGGR